MAKMKIPKRVAGVKIPKKVRRKARKALKLAESPAAREMAAAAFGAARPAAASIDGERVVEAFRVAALDGLRRFLEGFEEGLRQAAEREAAGPPNSPAADAQAR